DLAISLVVFFFQAEDGIRDEDTFPLLVNDRHRNLYSDSHIISFPQDGRKYPSRGHRPSDRARERPARMLNMLTMRGRPRYAEIRSPSMARTQCASSTATRRRERSRSG